MMGQRVEVETVMAINLTEGMTVWHHGELRTVAEVFVPTMVLKDRVFVLWNDGTRVIVDKFREFPIYWRPEAVAR